MIENEFSNMIKKISDERGKDIFLEPKKLKSLLLDYIKNEFETECDLLATILKTDSIKYINEVENFIECKQFLVKRLEDKNNLDDTYNALIKDLRQNLSLLANKIKPKVYEYGFLVE